jgi:ABC-type sugar transport system ATPase subunit
VNGLELESVRVAYGNREALRGVDLSVPRGELLAVLGPSGSGKSTLLRAIAGLEPLRAGTVRLAGRDISRTRPGRRNVAMVFQSYALFPHLSVLDNIRFGLEVRDVHRSAARARALEAARAAGCDGLLDRRPGELSGGERQRVALARALAREPDAYLLDEPLSNLDAELREQTRTELRALHDRVGGTMIHVTHDQTEALVLGDRVAILRDGVVEQVGTPDEIWSYPATVFVARFVGSPTMNLLPVGSPLRPPSVLAEAAPDRLLGIRPDAVVLGAQGQAAAVTRVDVVGADAHVHLRVGDDELVARVPSGQRPRPGDTVRVSVSERDVHLFDAQTGSRLPR